jgi:hypothetical protein
MQSTPNNSIGVLSGVSPLAERCMSLNYKYLVTVFHKLNQRNFCTILFENCKKILT